MRSPFRPPPPCWRLFCWPPVRSLCRASPFWLPRGDRLPRRLRRRVPAAPGSAPPRLDSGEVPASALPVFVFERSAVLFSASPSSRRAPPGFLRRPRRRRGGRWLPSSPPSREVSRRGFSPPVEAPAFSLARSEFDVRPPLEVFGSAASAGGRGFLVRLRLGRSIAPNGTGSEGVDVEFLFSVTWFYLRKSREGSR